MSVKNKEKVRLLADVLATDETLMAGLNVVQTAEETIDTIRQDMFNHMSIHATAILREEEGSIDLVMKVFNKFEHKYKKDNKLQSMPGSYRSSKSVIINALRHGVELTGGGDTPKGKTALERQIKQARKTGATAVSVSSSRYYAPEQQQMEQARHAISNIRTGHGRATVTEEELKDLLAVAECLAGEAARLKREIQAILDARA